MLILGIESSCDETAAAVVEDGRKVLSSVVASQVDIHALYGGVVPEIASRAHCEAICATVRDALDQAGVDMGDIEAISVTNRPGLIGALLTGLSYAKGLAYSSGKPTVPTHHIRGHVAANYVAFPELKPPFLALVISGGHTSLLKVDDYTKYTTLGVTRDDAAGEAFDKAARVLGLPYPGGAAMDRLAAEGNKNAIPFSECNVDGSVYDFSFSGLKTNVVNFAHRMQQNGEEMTEQLKRDLAASFTKAVVRSIEKRLGYAMNEYSGLPVVLAGGVAANSHIRAAVSDLAARHGVQAFVPPLKLCGDNAVMIAAQGYYEYISGVRGGPELNAFASESV